MLAEITAMQLYCLRIGRLTEEERLSDTIAALGKLNNTVKAREVIAEARNLLGGNGILLENHVMRHMADIEAIYTFEGTETIQTLVVGRDITGEICVHVGAQEEEKDHRERHQQTAEGNGGERRPGSTGPERAPRRAAHGGDLQPAPALLRC